MNDDGFKIFQRDGGGNTNQHGIKLQRRSVIRVLFNLFSKLNSSLYLYISLSRPKSFNIQSYQNYAYLGRGTKTMHI